MGKELCDGKEQPEITVSEDIFRYARWRDAYRLAFCQPTGIAEEKLPKKINASKTDWVELCLALHAADVLPGSTQEAIIDIIQGALGISLENWEQLGTRARLRNPPAFLHRLINSLTEHTEELDDDRRARRRPKI